MKSNPILEEVWRIKDHLAAEAGYDMNRYCENLREWVLGHPLTGPLVRNAEELRQLIAEKDRQRAASSTLSLNEEPPKPENRR